MIRTYDTTPAEEKALEYIAAQVPVVPRAPTETAADVFARLVRHVLSGPVQSMRAAGEGQRAAAYEAATDAQRAAVDAALGLNMIKR